MRTILIAVLLLAGWCNAVPKYTPTLVHRFLLSKDNADWTDSLGDMTVSADATYTMNAWSAYVGNNDYQGAPTFTKQTGSPFAFSRMAASYSPSVNLSTANVIRIRFYVHPGVDGEATSWRHIQTAQLYLSSNSSPDSSNSHFFDIFSINASGYSGGPGPGWYTIDIPINGGATNAATLTAIIKVRFDITAKIVGAIAAADATPAITIDSIEAYNDSAPATIMFRFDDGYAQQYQALTYLESKGFRGSVGVAPPKIPAILPNTSYMSLAQIKEKSAIGHLFVNHYSLHEYHTADYAGYTAEDLAYAFEDTAQWMLNHGLGKGRNYFMLPGGKWYKTPINWDSVFRDRVVMVWRTSTYGNEEQNFCQLDPRVMCARAVDVGDTYASLTAQVDKAIASRSVFCMYWHSSGLTVVNNAIDPASVYAQIVDYVKTKVDAGLCRVVTPDTLLLERDVITSTTSSGSSGVLLGGDRLLD
jgi:hypothetical protein